MKPRRPNSDYGDGQTLNGVHTVAVHEDGPPYVVCEECAFERSPNTPAAARKAAHRHVERSGHLVTVTRIVTYQYGPVNEAARTVRRQREAS